MKFLTVFAAILAVAFGAQSHWTLGQLSEALESPHTNPSLVPILEQALNSYMEALFAGQNHEYISISTAAVDLSTWTLHELSEAMENPNTSPAILPYLENALNSLMEAIYAGEVQATSAQVAIEIPALEISYWTLADLEQALASPSTSPAMISYLEQAVNHIVQNLFSGVQQTSIVLAIPAEAAKPIAVIDPVQVVDQAVVDAPVVPEVVTNPIPAPAAPLPAGSPLVQIILNINQQSVTPAAEIEPTPIDNGEIFPNPRPPAPVNPRPPAPVNPRPPAPVVDVPEPDVIPEPVVLPNPPTPEVEPVVVVPEPNPIDVIAVNPEPINPIEAIAISPPEVNPVDLLNPVIVPAVVAGDGDIGPM